MHKRHEVMEAIRRSWTRETSAVPDEWSTENPARGQCDASSFVFWELLGGNLVLAEVFTDGERTEHHYWNRLDGEDIDLTLEQFVDGEEIREKLVVANDHMHERIPTMRTELRNRVELMRQSVLATLNA